MQIVAGLIYIYVEIREMQNFVPLTITAGLKIFPCITTDRVIGQVWTQTLSLTGAATAFDSKTVT